MKHILDRTSFAELRELFKRAQKAREYARHNPPMEKRTTRFICRLGRGAHAFDSAVSERLAAKAVPLFWQLAFIEAVKAILSSDDAVTISHLDAVMERGAVLMSDKVLFSRGHLRFVKTLLPKVVQTLTDSFEAFRTNRHGVCPGFQAADLRRTGECCIIRDERMKSGPKGVEA